MKPAYAARLMIALPGDEPIEYARWPHRYPERATLNAIFRSLSRCWEWWIETPLPSRSTVTARPGAGRRSRKPNLAVLEWPPSPHA
jgi:hypothetical protein